MRQAGDTIATNGNEFGMAIEVDPFGNPVITGYYNGALPIGTDTLPNREGLEIFLAKYNPQGEVLWARRAGGENPGKYDVGKDVSIDRTGNIYLTGSFAGPADFSGIPIESKGVDDAFIAKYDPEGAVQWVVTLGGDREERLSDSGMRIATNAYDETVVTGYFYGDLYVNGAKTPISSTGREDIFILVVDAEGRLKALNKAGLPL